MPDKLTELEALFEKATKGEWEAKGVCIDGPNGVVAFTAGRDDESTSKQDVKADTDAAFIVALHNAFPWLLLRLCLLEDVAEAAKGVHGANKMGATYFNGLLRSGFESDRLVKVRLDHEATLGGAMDVLSLALSALSASQDGKEAQP